MNKRVYIYVLSFTVALSTPKNVSTITLLMRLKPENGQQWMQWVWWWCYTSKSVQWRWWTVWWWWTEWTILRRWTRSPPVMSTPACGAWVNWVSTCPPPRPSTQTPSVGKSKVKDRGAHTSGGVTLPILFDQLCYQYSLLWYIQYTEHCFVYWWAIMIH